MAASASVCACMARLSSAASSTAAAAAVGSSSAAELSAAGTAGSGPARTISLVGTGRPAPSAGVRWSAVGVAGANSPAGAGAEEASEWRETTGAAGSVDTARGSAGAAGSTGAGAFSSTAEASTALAASTLSSASTSALCRSNSSWMRAPLSSGPAVSTTPLSVSTCFLAACPRCADWIFTVAAVTSIPEGEGLSAAAVEAVGGGGVSSADTGAKGWSALVVAEAWVSMRAAWVSSLPAWVSSLAAWVSTAAAWVSSVAA
mmetsp:Transcript_43919/g.70603  ORF Transcript_43919/g.70603 Transcript_43919/m.70603 type:complete len:260 (+) Transcript_43919:316-1095(+)